MILFYGKGRVSDGVRRLAESVGIQAEVLDDSDADMDLSRYDAVIPTPGVAPSNRVYASTRILAEMDFAARYLPRGFKTVCVTGTDGKSTTAWILYKLLCAEFGEEKVFLSGNFEVPFSETVRQIRERGLKRGYVVIEVSSFMAYNLSRSSGLSALESLPVGERSGGFHPDYSIFTNFETDHLNWHLDLQDYFHAKMRVFELTSGTSAINAQVFQKAEKLGLKVPELKNVRVFGMSTIEHRHRERSVAISGENDDEIATSLRSSQWQNPPKDRIEYPNIIVSGRRKYSMDETNFSGIHNAMNILSVAIITNAMKICSKRIREYLRDISGLSHRLEFVTVKNGVRFVDDSKSTSAQSLLAALGSFDRDGKLLLIAGGSDKGDVFEWVGKAMLEVVKHVELIGATRDRLAKICEAYGIDYHVAETMEEAVKENFKRANPGDTLLLSPGCASFGMFRDYLDRAEKFREAVNSL